MSGPELADVSEMDTRASLPPPDPENNNNLAVPRKRSKVSRACDLCRRKKVRCDAEYLTLLEKVTKVCKNCVKNDETCLFLRIPLKRGPSKNYIKDLEKKLESLAKPRAKSFDTATPDFGPPHARQPPLPPVHRPVPFPGHLHLLLALNIPNQPPQQAQHPPQNAPQGQQQAQIILPPLIGAYTGPQYQNHQQIPVSGSKNHILPPVVHAVKTGDGPLAPSSPRNSVNGVLSQDVSKNLQKTNSPPIQGPFWKVPYEMPGNNLSAALAADSGSGGSPASLAALPVFLNGFNFARNNSVSNSNTRRLSVDSISSSSTTGLRSRLPSLKPSLSVTSVDNGISDSDDDFYSVKSYRQLSQSLSPRNSVSSLLSLNGRISKNLLFGNNQLLASNSPHLFPQSNNVAHQQAYPAQYVQYGAPGPVFHGAYQPQHFQVPHGGPFQLHMHPQQHPQLHQVVQQVQPVYLPMFSKVPVQSIDHNLQTYYASFHEYFPILPFGEKRLSRALEGALVDDHKLVVDLFNLSLNSLNNYRHHSINDNILLLHKTLAVYPFHHIGLKLNDHVIVLFLSSLVILNYAILLNGDIYSLGISLTASILNDFKVLEGFSDYVHEYNASYSSSGHWPDLDHDDIKLYLPKLYYCLFVIDNCYCLSFGIQSVMNSNFDLLYKNLDRLLLPPDASKNRYSSFRISRMFNDLLAARNSSVFSRTLVKRYDRNWASLLSSVSSSSSLSSQENDQPSQPHFSSLFITLVKDKYELFDYVIEIVTLFSNFKGDLVDDEFLETLHDYHLKLARLVKRLSLSIINLANYLSTLSSQQHLPKSSSTNSPHSAGANNPRNPSSTINNELLNPFLNVSCGQSYRLIKLCKLLIDSLVNFFVDDSEMLSRCLKINNDLSIAFNLLISNLNSTSSKSTSETGGFVSYGLGSVSASIIKNKIESYNLSFNNLPIKVLGASDNLRIEKQTNNVISWKNDFFNTIVPFISKEDVDGWF